MQPQIGHLRGEPADDPAALREKSPAALFLQARSLLGEGTYWEQSCRGVLISDLVGDTALCVLPFWNWLDFESWLVLL